MQGELDAEGLALEIQILGINGAGLESGNAAICNGRDLPWLQETPSGTVWIDWEVAWRDVVILDVENRPVTSYNLSTHRLDVPANYETLKGLIRDAAQETSR
jgi:hypothetical protein